MALSSEIEHRSAGKLSNFRRMRRSTAWMLKGRLAVRRFTPICGQPVQGIVQTMDANWHHDTRREA